jgi:uncharacterized membrane protein
MGPSGLISLAIAAIIIAICVILFIKSIKPDKINIPAIYSSVILDKGEEITEYFKAVYIIGSRYRAGVMLFTNKRFLFLDRVLEGGANVNVKGYDIIAFWPWGAVISVSTSGSDTSKTLNFTQGTVNLNLVNNDDQIVKIAFRCRNLQGVAKKIIENKNNFAEKVVVQAKTIIIQEPNKDKASPMQILQERLARGEISLEEFHKLVQRT